MDQKPDQKLVIPSDLSDLQAVMDNSSSLNDVGATLDESSADDYWLTQEAYNAFPDFYRNIYTWQSTEMDFTSFPNDWARLYDVVYYSNVVLDHLDKMERNAGNASAWDNIKGSALFFRSWSFLKLAWIFSPAYDKESAVKDKGIVLRLGSDFNVKSYRSTVQETYDKIISDLKEAIRLLPAGPTHAMRPSRPAAYALLARAFLSMRAYDQAYLYADSCLALKNELLDYNDITPLSSNTPFPAFNKEVLFHSRIATYSYSLVSPTNAKVDTTIVELYEDSDLRKQLFFRPPVNRIEYRFKGNYAGTISNCFVGIATDEVYLIRAECNARLGKINKAEEDLNTLLSKRYQKNKFTSIAGLNQPQLLQKILIERRKELLFRGLRFADIKRLNKEGYNITPKRLVEGKEYSIPPNSPRYALPIPRQVIEQTGIEQN